MMLRKTWFMEKSKRSKERCIKEWRSKSSGRFGKYFKDVFFRKLSPMLLGVVVATPLHVYSAPIPTQHKFDISHALDNRYVVNIKGSNESSKDEDDPTVLHVSPDDYNDKELNGFVEKYLKEDKDIRKKSIKYGTHELTVSFKDGSKKLEVSYDYAPSEIELMGVIGSISLDHQISDVILSFYKDKETGDLFGLICVLTQKGEGKKGTRDMILNIFRVYFSPENVNLIISSSGKHYFSNVSNVQISVDGDKVTAKVCKSPNSGKKGCIEYNISPY